MTGSVAGIWQRIAGDSGGTVAALASALTDAGPVVFAATSVGVFRSTDGGSTWTAGTAVPFAEGLAVSTQFETDRTLFACTADGLYRSTDAGQTWQPVLVGSRILGVATLDGGVVIAGTEADGVLRSEDTGRTFRTANAGLLDLSTTCLATQGNLGFAGTPTGLHRTRNGARSWRPVCDAAIQCLAISDSIAFAGTEESGLLRCQDGGTTWHTVSSITSGGVTALATSDNKVAAATDRGIAISHDRGETWRISSSPGTVLALAVVGDTILAGLHAQGVARSMADAATWSMANAGLNARLLAGAVFSPNFASDRTLFAADIEAGACLSTDAGNTWRSCNDGLEEPIVSAMGISPDYAVDQTLYAVTPTAVYISRNAAGFWSEFVSTAVFGAAEVTAIAVCPDGTLLVATHTPAEAAAWRSTTHGWQRWLNVPTDERMRLAVSPEDARVLVGIGARVLDCTLPSGAITALATCDHDVFAGTTSGVYRSRDGGMSFADWSEGLTHPRGVVALGADRHSVYAVAFGGTVWQRDRA
jgi:BNR/Asp-box repeat protein